MFINLSVIDQLSLLLKSLHNIGNSKYKFAMIYVSKTDQNNLSELCPTLNYTYNVRILRNRNFNNYVTSFIMFIA